MTPLENQNAPGPTGSSGCSLKLNPLYVLVGVQAVCWLVFLFGDIGFDKAGKFGLDHDAFILVAIVYGIALIAGLVLAFKQRRKLLAATQLVPVVCFFASLF